MQEPGRLNRIAILAGKYVWSAPAMVYSPQFAFMARQLNAGKPDRYWPADGQYPIWLRDLFSVPGHTKKHHLFQAALLNKAQ